MQVRVQNCVVTVSANDNVIEVVDPPGSPRRPRTFTWKIVDANYRFSSDVRDYGIVILDFDPTREFERPMRQDTTFTLHFNNTFKHPGYKYAINIEKTDGTRCASLDPWVVN